MCDLYKVLKILKIRAIYDFITCVLTLCKLKGEKYDIQFAAPHSVGFVVEIFH